MRVYVWHIVCVSCVCIYTKHMLNSALKPKGRWYRCPSPDIFLDFARKIDLAIYCYSLVYVVNPKRINITVLEKWKRLIG